VANLERKVIDAKEVTNKMCELAGVDPVYPGLVSAVARSGSPIRADQFYGKVMSVAAREYLELRKRVGPAAPREICEALAAGGFRFDTKIELNRLAGLRAVLRKNSAIFRKMTGGQYGLSEWYPNTKADKRDDGPAERGQKRPRPTVAKKRTQKAGAPVSRRKKDRAPSLSLAPVVLAALSDGKSWGYSQLRQYAIAANFPDVDESTPLPRFHGTLLALKTQGKVTAPTKGMWQLIKENPAAEAA
jgi:hypothetical protein